MTTQERREWDEADEALLKWAGERFRYTREQELQLRQQMAERVIKPMVNRMVASGILPQPEGEVEVTYSEYWGKPVGLMGYSQGQIDHLYEAEQYIRDRMPDSIWLPSPNAIVDGSRDR